MEVGRTKRRGCSRWGTQRRGLDVVGAASLADSLGGGIALRVVCGEFGGVYGYDCGAVGAVDEFAGDDVYAADDGMVAPLSSSECMIQNPRTQERLHAELKAELGGHAPTSEDLTRLPFLRMVIDETMRLYPPAWTIADGSSSAGTSSRRALPNGKNPRHRS